MSETSLNSSDTGEALSLYRQQVADLEKIATLEKQHETFRTHTIGVVVEGSPPTIAYLNDRETAELRHKVLESLLAELMELKNRVCDRRNLIVGRV